jgi:UDP-N-acetylglucosamine--N-acetylmuramyl-(pentapeptide) pyrophosphoryl-undecaprenol N-acetylglucosamine transferase
LAELIYCRVPSVLVPFPYATADHQYYNAKILADAGCAKLVREDKDLEKNLLTVLSALSQRRGNGRLAAMRRAYRGLKIPNPITSAKKIADILRKL